MTPEPTILSFLDKHPINAQILSTGFNPYLRDGNGQQHNWNVSLMFPERMTSMSCYFSTSSQIGEETQKPSVAEVLTGLVQEARLLATTESPAAFTDALNLQDDGLYEKADAEFLYQAAARRSFQLQALLGEDVLAKLVMAGEDFFAAPEASASTEGGDTTAVTPKPRGKRETVPAASTEQERKDANTSLDSAGSEGESPAAVDVQEQGLPPSTKGADLLDIDAW